MTKTYELPNGRKMYGDFDENGIGKITVQALDSLVNELNEYAEQSGWEEMTVQCKHCGKDMTFKIATIGEPCEDCKYKSMADQEPMREFTEEEAKAYSKALDKMYKPTGFNVFDKPCEDAVSRASINRLQKYRYNCGETSITCVSLISINTLPSVQPTKFSTRCPECGAWFGYNIKGIEQEPSVQPKTECDHPDK